MKTLGGKFGLISSRQKLRCRVLLRVATNWLCAQTEEKSLIIGAPRPFYACQAFLCLPAHTCPFMLVWPFYAYQQTSCSNSCISVCEKKMKSTYLEMTVFSRAVCPVRVFAPAEKSDGTF